MRKWILILLGCSGVSLGYCQHMSDLFAEDVKSVDAIIKAYYEVVSGPAGKKRDWQRDHYLHHPSAKIWIAGYDLNGKKSLRSMTLTQYHESAIGLVNTGFFEYEISRKERRFGNIVHVWSTYEWRLTANGEVGGRGINSIELFFDGERYWIVSWIFDNENEHNRIPDEYLQSNVHGQFHYFGEAPPGAKPKLFAEGLISTALHEHSSPVFSPDGCEVYWSVFYEFSGPQKILFMKWVDGAWTKPKEASFSTHFKDGNPFMTSDGNRIYFDSTRPVNPTDSMKSDYDIWYVDRTETGWSDPVHLTSLNSNKHDRGVSISQDGTLYFCSARDGGYGNTDIYFSRMENGEFKEAINAGNTINTGSHESWPFIAKNGKFLLFEVSHTTSLRSKGINISFSKDLQWTMPRSLGNGVNQSGQNRFPKITIDGKYLFFVSSRQLNSPSGPGNGWGDVYWIQASILNDYR